MDWPLLQRLRHGLRALRHRNFRLFVVGQLISLSGTWMQQVAVGWLVYRLTNSPFLLGVVSFAGLFPTLLLAPWAGVFADRLSRHRMILVAQTLAMLQAFALAGMVMSGRVGVGWIIALTAFLGFVSGIEVPARQAFLVEMVAGRSDLASAIALNSSTFNSARLIGPAVAGLIISWLGEGPVFLLNGLSYLAVIAALLAMRLPPAVKPEGKGRLWGDLHDGLGYVSRCVPVRDVLVFLAAISLLVYPYMVLLPAFTRDYLGGGAHTFGFLVGASGLGAVTGVLALATRPSVRGLGRILALAVAVIGGSLTLLAFTRAPVVALVLLFAAGGATMVHLAASNTLVQTIVDDDKRGRVMSLFATAHLGMVPIGGLLTGTLAAKLGTPAAILVAGLTGLQAAAIFAFRLKKLRAHIRPIYIKLGIIEAGAAGVEGGLRQADRPEDAGEAEGAMRK